MVGISSSEVLVTSKCPKAAGVKLAITETVKAADFFLPSSGCLGHRARVEAMFWVIQQNVPEQIGKSLCLMTCLFLFELIFSIYWCEVDLQCFVVGVPELVQLCLYIYVFFFRFCSHIDYQSVGGVPCAIRKVLVDYLF